MNDFYGNIGGKIKGWAITIFIFGAIACIISGLVLIGNDAILVGILTIIIGTLAAWVSSWLLYAFGELVEKTVMNEENTREILKFLKKDAEAPEQPKPVTIQSGARVSAPSVSSNKDIPGGWTCTCGRKHADYDSSCVCGVTKWEAKQAAKQAAPATTQNPIPGGWACTCGKQHADYESSCVCGVTKWEAKQAKQ